MQIAFLLTNMAVYGMPVRTGYSTGQQKDQVPNGDLAPAASVPRERAVSFPVKPPFIMKDICSLNENKKPNLLNFFQIDKEYLDTDPKFIDHCISNLYNVIKENEAEKMIQNFKRTYGDK